MSYSRWGASTVKTEDQGRRTLEDNFFESFVPRPKQVVHNDILRNYPILAAYVFRSMGRQNLRRRAGDAMYTTPRYSSALPCIVFNGNSSSSLFITVTLNNSTVRKSCTSSSDKWKPHVPGSLPSKLGLVKLPAVENESAVTVHLQRSLLRKSDSGI
jgi:hypothetical protein